MLILLIGCRSAPSTYYTLVSSAPEQRAAVSDALQLEVLPVDVPPDVDRAEIVVRQGADHVTPVETRLWISPLKLEIRRAFSDDLTHELGVRDVANVTAQQGIPTYRVKLSVQRFESVLDDHALIEAISTVREAGGSTPVLVCSHRARQPASRGYDALAEAHQLALAAIAKQVAADVKSVSAAAPACAK
ncbi:MAG TPA: PqiC family protein [Kofleriaceae bacterium]